MRQGGARDAGKGIDRKPARAAEYPAVGETGHFAGHHLEVARGRGCPPDPDFEITHDSRLVYGPKAGCAALGERGCVTLLTSRPRERPWVAYSVAFGLPY